MQSIPGASIFDCLFMLGCSEPVYDDEHPSSNHDIIALNTQLHLSIKIQVSQRLSNEAQQVLTSDNFTDSKPGHMCSSTRLRREYRFGHFRRLPVVSIYTTRYMMAYLHLQTLVQNFDRNSY
jgi:hypothetical protein